VPKPLMVTVGPDSWAPAWMAKLAAESAASALHILFIVMLSPVISGMNKLTTGPSVTDCRQPRYFSW